VAHASACKLRGAGTGVPFLVVAAATIATPPLPATPISAHLALLTLCWWLLRLLAHLDYPCSSVVRVSACLSQAACLLQLLLSPSLVPCPGT
jgi:hypothetical protein